MSLIGLYVHVPFCAAKCPYCDFYSKPYDKQAAFAYAEAVIRNCANADFAFDTVYFGGGTPILLAEEVAVILENLRKKIAPNAEITLEANPNSTTEKNLKLLKNAGVNRLSFGVQSFCDNELKQLGRLHSAEQAGKAVLMAKSLGFDDISVDLMLGIPLQTPQSLEYSLEQAASLPISHVSVYMLKIEAGTPFAARKLLLPDDDETAEMYLFVSQFLQEHGFEHYEISNFARNERRSRHNLKYWRCEEYLGIGPSAHSFIGGKRFAVSRDLDGFINSPLQKTDFTDENAGGFEEWAMLRLRLSDGISLDELEGFDVDRDEILRRAANVPRNLLQVDDKKIALTTEGFLLSNSVIGRLIFG